jgi:transcriptional regulator with XRE-family HTH domain
MLCSIKKEKGSMEWWIELGYPAFTAGKNGFPRTGQVVKYYRQHKKDGQGKMVYSQEKLAQALGIKPKAVWNIENRDADISTDRRILLCNLLGISGALLGVRTLEEIEQMAQEKRTKTLVGTPHSSTIDIQEHTDLLASAYRYHKHENAHWMLDALSNRMDDLYRELPHRKNQYPELAALLGRYHNLIASILREDQQYSLSLSHSHKALFFANELSNDEQHVAALIIEARTFEDAGCDVQALQLFEKASHYERRVPAYLNGVRYLYSAPIAARLAQSETERHAALHLLDHGERIVQANPDKSQFDFTLQRYFLCRGETLVAIGWTKSALSELNLVQRVDGSWWEAYQDLYMAMAYLKSGNYPLTASYAKSGLEIVQKFNSKSHIARVAALHSQLVASPYGKSRDVAELGRMLSR